MTRLEALIPLVIALTLFTAGCLTPSTLESASTPDPADAAAPVLGAYDGLRSPADVVEELTTLEAHPLVTVKEIGTSVEDRPLHLVTVGEGERELWIAARHHGNEPTGTEAAMNVLQYLTADEPRLAPGKPSIVKELVEQRSTVLERLTIHIVPVVNPDGAHAFTRGNALGVDLNRDYAVFTQPESRAVRDAFWTVRPDAGLDLHNEGLYGGYDFDAFYPEVPRIEEEVMTDVLEMQWLTVHEVDAAGGYAGGPNENYKLVGNTSNVIAYWPGTHDAFLSIRGAPAWTPEGAIDSEATYPWSVNLHEVTVASTMLREAGLHARDERVLDTRKHHVDLGGTLDVPVTEGDMVQVQAVWSIDDATTLMPDADVTVTLPDGSTVGPDAGVPGSATETHVIRDAPHGAYTVHVDEVGPAGGVELRVTTFDTSPAPVQVERVDPGLHVVNTGTSTATLRVTDTVTGDAPLDAPGAWVRVVDGNLEPRTLVTWNVTLESGDHANLTLDADGRDVGPWRAVTVDGGEPRFLVGEERSAPAH